MSAGLSPPLELSSDYNGITESLHGLKVSVVQLPSRKLSLHLSVRGQSDQKCTRGYLVASLLGLSGKICIWESLLDLS